MPNLRRVLRAEVLRLRGEHGVGLVAPLVGAGLLALAAFAAVAVLSGLRHSAVRADGSARAAAQTAIAQIESCNATRHDYRQCTSAFILSGAGLPLGAGPGHLDVSAPNSTAYTIVATSALPGPDGLHATFAVYKDSAGMTRNCNHPGIGGCSTARSW